MAGDECRSMKSIGVPPVCCAHMKAISEYGILPLNAGDGVDNTKGDAEATFMKLYGSMPCVGVGVKSIVPELCKAIAGSNWGLFRAGVIGKPWHMSRAAFDFTSLGKQSYVEGGEGVKSNKMAPFPKDVSKPDVSISIGCCGVEFLDGGVRTSENEEADEKLPAVDEQEEGHDRGWLL